MTIDYIALRRDLEPLEKLVYTDLNIYVDSAGGNDTTADGSYTLPFKTLAAAALLAKGYKNISAIYIRIKDGSVFGEDFKINNWTNGVQTVCISAYDAVGATIPSTQESSFTCSAFIYNSKTTLGLLVIETGVNTTSAVSGDYSFLCMNVGRMVSYRPINTFRFQVYLCGYAFIKTLNVTNGFLNANGIMQIESGTLATNSNALGVRTEGGITITSSNVSFGTSPVRYNGGQWIQGSLATSVMPDYTTISYPSEGRQAWNLTAHKPVYYNGTSWVYADGTTV